MRTAKRRPIETVNLDNEREMDAFSDQVIEAGVQRVRAEGDELRRTGLLDARGNVLLSEHFPTVPQLGENRGSMPQGANSSRQILKATPLFAALDESELNSLAARCGIQSFSAGQILFSEGEPCTGLYIVVSGRVRIFKTSPSGREHVLTVEGPGASVAELPVFDGGTYPASASALEATEMLFVSRGDLRAICLEKPEVSLKLLQVVGARLRRLVGIIEELSFTTVRHRLISWLLRQAGTEGRQTERGVVFSLNASHQELAAQIGTVRELVSRNLARLQAQSFIEMNGREITILDQAGLEADLASIV